MSSRDHPTFGYMAAPFAETMASLRRLAPVSTLWTAGGRPLFPTCAGGLQWSARRRAHPLGSGRCRQRATARGPRRGSGNRYSRGGTGRTALVAADGGDD
jgi:hypothetical protein